jgi:Putative MetA-pathway of phenol degradation
LALSIRRTNYTLCVLTAVVGAASTARAQTAAPAGQQASVQTEPRDLINADRPGIADGSGVLGPGILQLEVGFQREFTKEDQVRTRISFVPTLVRVGLGAGFEARVETNAYDWEKTNDVAGTTHDSGWSPISVGAKYRIYDPDESRWPSLAVIGRVFPTSGSGAFGSHRYAGDLRLAADLDLSSTFSLNPNVGFARYEAEGGSSFAALTLAVTLTFLPSPRVQPFVDAGFQNPADAGSPASLLIDAGVAYIIAPNLQLDVSLGKGAHGPTPHTFVSFGVSVRTRR